MIESHSTHVKLCVQLYFDKTTTIFAIHCRITSHCTNTGRHCWRCSKNPVLFNWIRSESLQLDTQRCSVVALHIILQTCMQCKQVRHYITLCIKVKSVRLMCIVNLQEMESWHGKLKQLATLKALHCFLKFDVWCWL